MKTPDSAVTEKVARVAIGVRLYFDVPVTSENEDDIRRAALAELERVEDTERIRIKMLRFPAVYPRDDYPALKPKEFIICDISQASEVNEETHFPL